MRKLLCPTWIPEFTVGTVPAKDFFVCFILPKQVNNKQFMYKRKEEHCNTNTGSVATMNVVFYFIENILLFNPLHPDKITSVIISIPITLAGNTSLKVET